MREIETSEQEINTEQLSREMTRKFFDMKMAEIDIVFGTNVAQSIKDAIFNALRQEFDDKDFDTACRGVTLGETNPPNALTFLEYAPAKINAIQKGE